ncbi:MULTISPECIES: MotE family protein [unclassified Desulfurobacterium]|uniref:MotE family protein n=2 Tax=unclassified Desulfurobacterium TaxID=2639089 RepID=UPI00042627C6|nr:hypothetical protein [Desulfurobacterium sp. TC5-1]
MRYLAGVLVILLLMINPAFSQEAEKVELQKEIKRLTALREEVQKLIQKNESILKKIEEERKKLAEEKKAFEEELKSIQNERYKRLAKIFSKMDPELAGQKISAMDNMTEAAYIFLNMKERYAGQILNYVRPDKVNEIVRIMAEVKKQKGG